MKLNFRARLHNRAFVITMSTAVIAFVYQILSLVGITPRISEESTVQLVMLAVNILCALGVFIDPTTEGISDSERAMKYYSSEE
ncbi:MAG: phage holin [Ruminococcaceae bacterium]|nr:phage holin [Oscillospiraceae bacterium]